MTRAEKKYADLTEGLIHLVEELFYRSNGNPEELAASTDEFLKTLPQEGALSPLVHGLKRLVQAKHLSMGRKPESAEAAGEAYGLLQTLDPRMAFLARLLMLENDGTETSRDMAAGELRKMISSSRERGDKPLEALALSLLSRMLESGSSFDESVQCGKRAIEIFKELGSLRLEAQVWNGLGILYAFEDRNEDSILAFEQSLALANACDNGQMAAGVIMNMGLTFQNWVTLSRNPPASPGPSISSSIPDRFSGRSSAFPTSASITCTRNKRRAPLPFLKRPFSWCRRSTSPVCISMSFSCGAAACPSERPSLRPPRLWKRPCSSISRWRTTSPAPVCTWHRPFISRISAMINPPRNII